MSATAYFIMSDSSFDMFGALILLAVLFAALLLLRVICGTIGWLVNRRHYDREWFWYYFWAPDDWWKPFAYPYAVLVLGGWHHMRLAIRDRKKDYDNDPSPAERTQGTWGEA